MHYKISGSSGVGDHNPANCLYGCISFLLATLTTLNTCANFLHGCGDRRADVFNIVSDQIIECLDEITKLLKHVIALKISDPLGTIPPEVLGNSVDIKNKISKIFKDYAEIERKCEFDDVLFTNQLLPDPRWGLIVPARSNWDSFVRYAPKILFVNFRRDLLEHPLHAVFASR